MMEKRVCDSALFSCTLFKLDVLSGQREGEQLQNTDSLDLRNLWMVNANTLTFIQSFHFAVGNSDLSTPPLLTQQIRSVKAWVFHANPKFILRKFMYKKISTLF